MKQVPQLWEQGQVRTHRSQSLQLPWGLQQAQRLAHCQGLELLWGFPGVPQQGLHRMALQPQEQVPDQARLQGLLHRPQ